MFFLMPSEISARLARFKFQRAPFFLGGAMVDQFGG
jgi:hypothetical protein